MTLGFHTPTLIYFAHKFYDLREIDTSAVFAWNSVCQFIVYCYGVYKIIDYPVKKLI